MGKAMIIIPAFIYAILLAFMFWKKPMFVAANDSSGKRALIWKRALITDLVITIALVVVMFMFAPEVFTMF
jgi:hypothetical protein